jgi:hypothetical protein
LETSEGTTSTGEAAVRGASLLAIEHALSPEILPQSFSLAD